MTQNSSGLRTKIICTMGPSIDSEASVKKLMESGMSVIRFNCSHGNPEIRLKQLHMVRRVEKKIKRPLAIMLDLQGPKMRVGDLPEPFDLKNGEVWNFVFGGKANQAEKIIPMKFDLAKGVSKGSHFFLCDGLLEVEVEKVSGKSVSAKIIHGGVLESRKGLNIPFYRGHIEALSEQDRRDVHWGVEHNVDFIALSFVRHAKDILALKDLIKKAPADHTPLIVAKIEKPEAVDNLDEIIQVSDGILVARGDLGIELKQERVPVVQKQIIERCRFFKKPVIVATQMLDSMRFNPVPTRAEVSDVASAIYAHSDALLLTGETSSGKYPIETTEMLAKIIYEVENHMIGKDFRKRPGDFGLAGYEDAFIFNVMQTAADSDAKAIVILNRRGVLTKILSKMHPKQPVYSMASTDTAYRQLSLYWGVFPIQMTNKNTNKRIEVALSILKKQKVVVKNDRLIFVYRDFQTDYLNLKIVDV